MSKFKLKVFVIGAGLVLGAAPLLSVHAANRCDLPQTGAGAKACAAAAQGPAELRRFVERTRAVYGLSYSDYARPEKESPAAESSSKGVRPLAQLKQDAPSQ